MLYLPSISYIAKSLIAKSEYGCVFSNEGFIKDNLLNWFCYEHSWPLFEFYWKWIFPWIKLSWHSGSGSPDIHIMWAKLEWLNWFWQFLYNRLSSFNPKGFYYSYVWSCSLCKGRTSFCAGLISRKLHGFFLMFSTGSMSFSSIDHLQLHAQFLILFHLT